MRGDAQHQARRRQSKQNPADRSPLSLGTPGESGWGGGGESRGRIESRRGRQAPLTPNLSPRSTGGRGGKNAMSPNETGCDKRHDNKRHKSIPPAFGLPVQRELGFHEQRITQ